jgi:hypothetical protein
MPTIRVITHTSARSLPVLCVITSLKSVDHHLDLGQISLSATVLSVYILFNHHFPGLTSMDSQGPPVRPEASSSSVSRDRSSSRALLHTASSQRSSISDGTKDTKQDGDTKRQRTRYTRSTRGCFTCRSAKVKCDETTPTCLRCKMNQRPCQWPDPDQLAHPRKSRKMASGLKVSNTPVPTSRSREAIERDWREISALANTQRDRSIFFSIEGDLFPVSRHRFLPAVPSKLLLIVALYHL